MGKLGQAEPSIAEYNCDVSEPSSVTATFEKVLHRFGRIDYAVNCAGLPTNNKPSTECSVEEFDHINGVNIRGLWLCSREELKVMKEQSLSSETYGNILDSRAQRGAIVNIASGTALVGVPNSPAYATSKAGVVSLTRADAIDYSAHRIRVNAVLPGLVDTPMLRGAVGDVKAFEGMAAPMIPMKRLAQPEEIADAVLFLCSHRASYIQGHAMVVDGGYTTM